MQKTNCNIGRSSEDASDGLEFLQEGSGYICPSKLPRQGREEIVNYPGVELIIVLSPSSDSNSLRLCNPDLKLGCC